MTSGTRSKKISSEDDWWKVCQDNWDQILVMITHAGLHPAGTCVVPSWELSTSGKDLGSHLEQLKSRQEPELVEWLRFAYMIADDDKCCQKPGWETFTQLCRQGYLVGPAC